MAIKIDKADKAFSQYIRKRDKQCVRCNSPVIFNDEGIPVSHHNSHYFGRGNECTRFDTENCDTLCHGCHSQWDGNKEDYRDFKIKQLGKDRFNKLRIRASSICKKDREMSYLQAKEFLKSLK